MWTFSFMSSRKFYTFISSSWNILHEYETYFLFVELLHGFFSSWNQYCSWNLVPAVFCSWSLIYLDIFLRETCCMFFYSFVKLNLSWYSIFVKLIACWFFLRETWCILIFVCETCCLYIISSRNIRYLHLRCQETCYILFPHETFGILISILVKLIHWIFSLWNRYCSWICCMLIFFKFNLSWYFTS